MKRIRGWADYLTFVIRIRRLDFSILLVDLTLFILLLATSTIDLSVVTFAVGTYFALRLLVGAWKIVRNLRSFFAVRKNLERLRVRTLLRRNIGEFEVTDILPAERSIRDGFARVIAGEKEKFVMITSKDLNLRLQNNEKFMIKHDNRHLKRLRACIRAERWRYLYLLKFIASKQMGAGRALYNEKKLCMGSDLSSEDGTVRVHKGTYFDSVLSNDLCTSIFAQASTSRPTVFFDGTALMPVSIVPAKNGVERVARLASIGTTALNNHIGASTLALTSDRRILVWRQSQDSHVDAGKLVTSGNGSADWDDIRGNSLNDSVIAAMDRELREENGLPKNSKIYTMITGYFRWVEKGGKPQFVGLSRLEDVEYSDVVPREGRKLFESEGTPDFISNLDDLKRFISVVEKLDDLSIGLVGSLHILKQAIESKSKALEEFLFNSDMSRHTS